jgi:nucleotide-binding universal stress UspA family protein
MVELVSTGETPAEVQADHETAAVNLTKTVADSLKSTELSVDTSVRHGDPRRVIVDEAMQWGADLIIIGARGHSALERWLIGSVAQNVVAHAPCSVEVVRHA